MLPLEPLRDQTFDRRNSLQSSPPLRRLESVHPLAVLIVLSKSRLGSWSIGEEGELVDRYGEK